VHGDDRPRPAAKDALGEDGLRLAVRHLLSIQGSDGQWEGEMVWNTMLLSQYVLVCRFTQWPLSAESRRRTIRHFAVTRCDDGSWPMHREGPGYLFLTALAYVALRALGVDPEDPLVAPARRWICSRPHGILEIPTLGKLWLAMAGLYEYAGVAPIPPEAFLLPRWAPIHPDSLYCHTRQGYVAMSFLYGSRFHASLGDLTNELREELYETDYHRIEFARHRSRIAATDLFVRPSAALRLTQGVLGFLERHRIAPLRRRALRACLDRIVLEQRQSADLGLSPVDGLLNCLAMFAANGRDERFGRSMRGIEHWRWEDDTEGLRLAGARSSAWDTAFAVRAVAEARDASTTQGGRDGARIDLALRRAHIWLKTAQVREEIPERTRTARESVVGGWCFSHGAHRWPVSDCTAEALSAILLVESAGIVPTEDRLSPEWLERAADFILARQNSDGGFGSYERRRGPRILERANPTEMYANCMTERSYTECTASCVGALARFEQVSAIARADVRGAIERGVSFLRSQQRADGSYAGTWGVNFTYAIFHVIEALGEAGTPSSDETVIRAADWLASKQKPDGGWGEHWRSCRLDRYVEHPDSQVIMTAWALLALLRAFGPEHPAVRRAVEFLQSLQERDGAWPHQAQAGVFFVVALLDYRLYKDIFPTWALARSASLRRT
jgi:squalene/oxidosqualene cyclase-like protein